MSNEKKSTGCYEVGYGKPPVDFRFKPGVSGNPTGQSKKKLERAMSKLQLSADVLNALEEPITIKRNGKAVRVPYSVALLESTKMAALKGDKGARKLLFDLQQIALSTRANLLAREYNAYWELESIVAQRNEYNDPLTVECLNKYRRRTRLK